MEEDEEERQLLDQRKKHRQIHDMFRNRVQEGAFNILVRRHLIDNDTKFKEYFRLSPHLFNHVLNFVKKDLTLKTCNRHGNPISPEEKLCITLR